MIRNWIGEIADSVRDWFGGIIAGIFSFIHKYILEMIVMSFISLGICWTIGYFCNALYEMHFELQSVWGGFSAIGGAGVLASIKYIMDSWKNSPEGEKPRDDRSRSTSATQEIARKAGELMEDYAYNGKIDGKRSDDSCAAASNSKQSK